ncbi:MAG TPA: T9SS type A sorting domain-containing protein, partial [Bacteroidetes bacterium]|nr:T9SS type A sorting domain-containing protein [Bacteroidota bacterium]
IMSHYRFPVIIGADTISVDSSQLGNGRSHKTIAILDSVGKLMRYEVFISLEQYCYFWRMESNPWTDDMYIMASFNYSTWPWDTAVFVYRGDTLRGLGDFVLKFDRDLNLKWIKGTFPIIQLNFGMTTDRSGNFYFSFNYDSGGHGGAESRSILRKYNSKGHVVWQKLASGLYASVHDLQVVDDLLYWVGEYTQSFQLDGVTYSLPPPPPVFGYSNTGFIARLNTLDGELEWVMSDPAIAEAKRFSKIHVSPDHTMTLIGHFDQWTFTLDNYVMANNFSNGEDIDGVIFQLRAIPPPPPPEPKVFEPWFEVWPNPNSGQFSLGMNAEVLETARLVLWDLQGRKLREILVPVGENPFQVDLGDLAAGTYLLRLVDVGRNVEQTRRIVIIEN